MKFVFKAVYPRFSGLSPDLFPLYKDDSGRGVLPIPDVLDSVGMPAKDKQSILELILDASGNLAALATLYGVF